MDWGPSDLTSGEMNTLFCTMTPLAETNEGFWSNDLQRRPSIKNSDYPCYYYVLSWR